MKMFSKSVYKPLKEKGFYVEYVPQGVDDETVMRITRSIVIVYSDRIEVVG